MNDWRIGRLVRSQRIAFDLTSPSSYSLQDDNQRVGWGFYPSIDSTAANVWFTVSWDVGGSLLIPVYKPFFECSLVNNGDLPTKAVTFAGLTTALTGYLMIYTMPEKYLQAALQEFNSKYNF